MTRRAPSTATRLAGASPTSTSRSHGRPRGLGRAGRADWLADRPARRAFGCSSASRRVEPAVHAVLGPARRALAERRRPTLGATRPPAADGDLPAGADGAARGRRGRRRRDRPRRRRRRAAGVEHRDASRDLVAARPRTACARSLDAATSLPADDAFAQLTRALWARASSSTSRDGVQLDRPDRGPLARRRGRSRPVMSRTIVALGDGAAATVLEEHVARAAPSRARRRPVASRRHVEVRLGARRARSTCLELQDYRATTVAFQHRNGASSARARRCTGRSPSSVAPGPQPGRQPPRRRPQLGRPGRDRLRRRRPAVRPDHLHPPHRARTRPATCCRKGVFLDRARALHQGPDRHRAAARRHRQLPRRVRDAARRRRPLGRHPEPRDRPAGLPPRGALPARSGRSTRPSCSTSRAAASRPTRRASSSSSASSSRSSRACRWPMRRTACAPCSRTKWDAAVDAGSGATAAA